MQSDCLGYTLPMVLLYAKESVLNSRAILIIWHAAQLNNKRYFIKIYWQKAAGCLLKICSRGIFCSRIVLWRLISVHFHFQMPTVKELYTAGEMVCTTPRSHVWTKVSNSAGSSTELSRLSDVHKKTIQKFQECVTVYCLEASCCNHCNWCENFSAKLFRHIIMTVTLKF